MLLAAAGGVAQASSPRQAPAWLDEINRYRQADGLAAVTEQPAWDAGLQAHLNYLANTPQSYFTGQYQSLHTENPASPYYTADGAQEAGRSDLAVGGNTSELDAIDGWLTAPFHAIGMLRPALTQVALGFDAAHQAAALDVIGGLNFAAPPATAPVLFPGPGMTTNLSAFSGGESPNPLETCQWTGAAGLPLIALLTQAPAAGLGATLTGPGGAMTVANGQLCIVDETDWVSSDGVYGPTGANILHNDRAVLLFPRAALGSGTYSAAITQPGQAAITWSFTVAGPAGGTPGTGTGAGTTGTGTGTGTTGTTGGGSGKSKSTTLGAPGIKAVRAGTRVTITWTKVTGAVSYRISIAHGRHHLILRRTTRRLVVHIPRHEHAKVVIRAVARSGRLGRSSHTLSVR